MRIVESPLKYPLPLRLVCYASFWSENVVEHENEVVIVIMFETWERR